MTSSSSASSAENLEGVLLADLDLTVKADQCKCSECSRAVADLHQGRERCGVTLRTF